ncbi:hypothetical protein H072_9701 [Dactylellina haptotyla CBS 200.50]|uniref:Uncharacterized protein n=1 Tax=Dactylellina haptotyla (strain CBS 200.50) TaxID=1284197 RepID=S8A162_DACHA|nr:hypothetical protein H072_9701 [Dactylellina haptotyla CBS 200.50]
MLEDHLLNALAKMSSADLTKRQNNSPMPMPGGDHFGRDRWRPPLWSMILSAVLLGLIFISLISFAILTLLRNRRAKSPASDVEIKRTIAHQRRMSGISDTDPDNIKPVKRLRSFHMKGAVSPSSAGSSPRTPKTPGKDGLFNRFFRKKDGTRLTPLDEEKNESYASLNAYPDTPALDEKMLEASPPPTPAPAFGWNSNVGPGGNQGRRSTVDGSIGKDKSDVGEQSTAYKGDTRPPLGQRESDSFLQMDSRRASTDPKRLSRDYNENFQSRPSGGLFDDDDDERRPLGYDPDSRSGH